MKRIFGHWAWFIFFSALLASCPDVDLDGDTRPLAEVKMPDGITYKNGTLYFKEVIDRNTYASFLELAEKHKDAIKSVQINSGGGITHYGRQIGKWIYDNKVDVIVDGWCFSSCANYIFTAGKKKTIRDNALVGWHGSERDSLVFANTEDPHKAFVHKYPVSVVRLPKVAIVGRNKLEAKNWRERLQKSVYQRFKIWWFFPWKRGIESDRDFFKDIGVDIDVTVYGHYKGRFEKWKDDKRIIGWTFSIEAMKEFDIEDIEFAGEGTYPQAYALEKYHIYEYKEPIEHLRLPVK